ncbi:peptidase T [Companilactobacillus sp. RD055328]|uniref:peptidase T n=1 Tax=Companilactobacillus sp. RD055328 TaxID=2916634 RepID=UPI001FC8008E|nr:peptidase T [Companilactobacillus sp. RD055328]GKQ42668.1 peptidase T [Companilactobacillus sp. RD055328]
MEKYEKLLPRFLDYVKVNTRSDDNSKTIPSTKRQINFLNTLKTELEEIGLEEVKLNTKNYYLTAKISSNIDKDVPTIGFISHIDTADFNSENVNPQVVENYDGKSAITLDKSGEYVLDPKEFESLTKYKGQTLITTDGSTLLGADDKSGVSEIVTFAEYLLQHPELKHGDIKIAFGPDEEIGTGANLFDVSDFGADFAYTVDGGPLGELEYETFNAASLKVDIQGKNVHPGSAKNIMINAISLGIEFQNQLPQSEVPELTDGKEGFFHLLNFEGTVDSAHLDYIIRDFTRDGLNKRKDIAQKIADEINSRFENNPIAIIMNDDYYNMYEVIKDNMEVVHLAQTAMKNLNINTIEDPIRGGTDGSKISFMGLPTPNLFAGGENMHGRFEYVSLQTMEQAVDVLLEISELNAK